MNASPEFRILGFAALLSACLLSAAGLVVGVVILLDRRNEALS